MSDLIGQRRMARERDNAIFRPWRLAVAVGGLLVLLSLTHIPQAMMPKPFSGNYIDKLEHVVAYGTITLLFLLAFRKPPGVKVLGVLLLIGLTVGALDEITQPLVNRTASIHDLAADGVGIVLVCIVCLVVRRYRWEKGCASAVSP